MSDSAERIRAAQSRPLSYALSIVGCLLCAACDGGPNADEAARARALALDPERLYAEALEGDTPPGDSGLATQADAGAVPPDFDDDGLPDKVETKTGKFVSKTDTGTDPREPDTDHDGITDGEEVLGTKGGLDLPAMGVSPVHRNLLLEYDWFDEAFECAPKGVPHDHRPTPAILAAVSAAFAGAPVDNPDGTRGITLIHDYGQSPIFKGGTKLTNAVAVIEGGATDAAFKDFKKDNFASNRAGYFHYVLMAHRYRARNAAGELVDNSSGSAEFPGNALMVTLNCFTEPEYLSNTIMHELGHNLGLGHGGNENVNDKPNYNSVMNYFYQFSGVDTNCARGGDGRLDFSRGGLAPLQETMLYEPKGICNNVAWDWNGVEGIETKPVKFDVNKDKYYTELHDFNDWAFVLKNKSLSRVVVDPEDSPVCPPPPSDTDGTGPHAAEPAPSNTDEKKPADADEKKPTGTGEIESPDKEQAPSNTDETGPTDEEEPPSDIEEKEASDEEEPPSDVEEKEASDEEEPPSDIEEKEASDEEEPPSDIEEKEASDEEEPPSDIEEKEASDEEEPPSDEEVAVV